MITNGERLDRPDVRENFNSFFSAPKQRIKKESISIKQNTQKQELSFLVANISELVQLASTEGMLIRYWLAANDDERLRKLQHISQTVEMISETALDILAQWILNSKDFRLRGEMCYAMGMSEETQIHI